MRHLIYPREYGVFPFAFLVLQEKGGSCWRQQTLEVMAASAAAKKKPVQFTIDLVSHAEYQCIIAKTFSLLCLSHL